MLQNKIKELSHFSHLTGLEELWIAENQVSSFESVETLAAIGLECVYLEHNPIAEDAQYRKKVKRMCRSVTHCYAQPTYPLLIVVRCSSQIKEILPSLTQIDATAVGQEGRGIIGGGLAAGGNVQGFGMAAMTDAQRVKVMQILQQQAIDKAKREAEQKAKVRACESRHFIFYV